MTQQDKSIKSKRTKRVLKDISFDSKESHLALCHKDQGVANQADYALVLKGANLSEEFVQKIQQIQVTMQLPDFLSKFFYIWEEDAKVLATLLGYVEPVENASMEKDEAQKELQDWMNSKFDSFEILKSLHSAEDQDAILSALSEDALIALLQDQESIEKAITNLPTTKTEEGTLVSKEQNSNDVSKVDVQVEVVAKAEFDLIQKAMAEQQEHLTKALETIAQYEAEKKEQINKTRMQALEAAVGDKAQVIFKAISETSDDVFSGVVEVLNGMKEQVEKSKLFEESGASVEDQEPINESGLAKIIKAKYNLQ